MLFTLLNTGSKDSDDATNAGNVGLSNSPTEPMDEPSDMIKPIEMHELIENPAKRTKRQ